MKQKIGILACLILTVVYGCNISQEDKTSQEDSVENYTIDIKRTNGIENNIIKIVTPTGNEYGIYPYKDYDTKFIMTEGKGKYTVSIGTIIDEEKFRVKDIYEVYCDKGKTEKEIYLDSSYLIGYDRDKETYNDILKIANKLWEESLGDRYTYSKNAMSWVNEHIEYNNLLAKEVIENKNTLYNYYDVEINKEIGICSDYAKQYAALMRIKGIPCRYVVGTLNNGKHAWNEVYTDEDGWVIVDPTNNKFDCDTTGYKIESYW